MDFFETQERARKKTQWLVFYFVLALLGTIAASYAAALFIGGQLDGRTSRSRSRSRAVYQNYAPSTTGWWDPRLFFAVAGGVSLIVGLASAFKWASFRQGGGAVAESVGGRRVDPRTTDTRERRLLNVVEEMAIAAGVPVPAVYVLDEEPALNAFAAGLTPNDAVVAVTRGTLEKLDRDELQGVVGHEFSHILNGDMRLNVKLTAIVFGILVIGLIGRGILHAMGRGRIRVGGGKGKGGGGIAVVLAIGVALLIIGYVGYFFGRLIQAAVSRQREFLADASSVQFTRNPAGIAGALKKIGGYALGSRLDAAGSEQLGHFLFAQGFTSMFAGLWATHPPLDQRIRAIDAGWDGRLFAPPEVVDVDRESFVSAGLAPARPPRPATTITPVAAAAAIGTFSPAQVDAAQSLLASLPATLRTATQAPSTAPAVICGLLLDGTADMLARQRGIVASATGGEFLSTVDSLGPALRSLRPEHKLPLVQLSLPALRQLPPTALGRFTDLFDRLVDADGHVSTFEFALKSLLRRSLAQGRSPAVAGAQVWSFEAVAEPISVVLSMLALAAGDDPAGVNRAFAAGAGQLRVLEGRIAFVDAGACTLARFDTALDRLAAASGPIKQRLLAAGAHTVGEDGVIRTEEYELLRVVAAALGCPMPPLTAAA